jgi:hypothetical protein
VIALIGCFPAAHRLTSLRHAQTRATWEPAVLTVTGCLLALSVLVNP